MAIQNGDKLLIMSDKIQDNDIIKQSILQYYDPVTPVAAEKENEIEHPSDKGL